MSPVVPRSIASRLGIVVAMAALAPAPRAMAQSATPSGEAVYKKRCASCHDIEQPRTPTRSALERLSPARILRTLDFGVMMSVAYPLRRSERTAVAAYLGRGAVAVGPPASAMCGKAVRRATTRSARWSGWGPSTTNARFQTADAAGLTTEHVGRLELKWAFGFDGDITAFGAPTLIDGALFTGSASGTVHALDPATGCLHWTFQADGPVRSAPVAATDGTRRLLVFGDQVGMFYAVDARSGALAWKRRADPHEATRLTGSPAVHDGVVFVPAASWEETRALDPAYPCCTFRGSVTALRVRDGTVKWKSYMVDPPKRTGTGAAGSATFGPSGAGIWSAPTIDSTRGVLYVTTGDNYSDPASATSDAIVALSLGDGRRVWTRQTTPNDVFTAACGPKSDCGPDHDFGASAMLLRSGDGRDVLVAGQKSGMVYALDPDKQGAIIWQMRVGKGGLAGGVQWGMSADGVNVYASVGDAVRRATPPGGAPLSGAGFDPALGGGLTALRITDGTKAWFAASSPCVPPRVGCSPAQPGALTTIPGAVFSGSYDGHLRAFSTTNGGLLWDFDTVRDYATVNGVAASGGSLDGAGPVIADGMVYVNSGYPRFGGQRGNVLLAFGLAGTEPRAPGVRKPMSAKFR